MVRTACGGRRVSSHRRSGAAANEERWPDPGKGGVENRAISKSKTAYTAGRATSVGFRTIIEFDNIPITKTSYTMDIILIFRYTEALVQHNIRIGTRGFQGIEGKARSIPYIEKTKMDISIYRNFRYDIEHLLRVGYRVKSCEMSRIEFDTDKKLMDTISIYDTSKLSFSIISA